MRKLHLFLALPSFFLAPFAFCDVGDGADYAHGPALMSRALEKSNPMRLHPADFAASRPEPELETATRPGLTGSSDASMAARNRSLSSGCTRVMISSIGSSCVIENVLAAGISRGHATQGIVLPPPELSRVEGKLHPIFARPAQPAFVR